MSSPTMSFVLSPSPAPPPSLPNPPPQTLSRIFSIVLIAFLVFVFLLGCFCTQPEEEEEPPLEQQRRQHYIRRTRTTLPTTRTIHKDQKSGQLTVTFTYESQATVPRRKPQAADGADLCCICLEDFEVGEECRVLVGCNHLYHKACIDPWLAAKKNCPQCRGPVRGAFSKDLDAIV